jgi:SAM-dependent methyltransferase
MEQIRKFHNQVKSDLIKRTVKTGDHILDVGCGCGGDILKWKHNTIYVDLCDPDPDSLDEARQRSAAVGWSRSRFHLGDVLSCPDKLYNVICYNFSIQYIFSKREYFEKSIKAIKNRLSPGGLLIGCVPNSDMILMHPKFTDSLGNFFVRKDKTGNGCFGEKVYVNLSDTPYYNEGPRSEPIAYKDILIAELEKHGIVLCEWTPFWRFSDLSRMYCSFIFQYI